MKRTAIVICALISLGVAGPAFAGSKTTLAQSEVAQRPHHEIREAVPKPAGPLDSPPQTSQSYAAREQAAPELASFDGGHNGGLYIGGSTLAVVLLIVLLIVLI